MMKSRVSPAAVAATLAAALAVIAGLVLLGTPSHARERKLDEIRVNDLASISAAIDEFWAKRTALPDSLDSLVSAQQLDRVPKDPGTNSPYTYLRSGDRSYRLCATFQHPSDTSVVTRASNVVYYANGSPQYVADAHSWRHGAGESCFDLTPPRKAPATQP
jgi:hypothetical protein